MASGNDNQDHLSLVSLSGGGWTAQGCHKVGGWSVSGRVPQKTLT